MSKRVKRLTPSHLKGLILDEIKNLQLETLEQGKEDTEKVQADEVEASDLAGSLEKDIDHMKVLKIQESRLMEKVQRVRRAKNILRKRIASKI